MNDVDVNLLIQNYHNKISTLYNQNILLETKIQTIIKDFTTENERLLVENNELRSELEDMTKKPTKKISQDKFIDPEVE